MPLVAFALAVLLCLAPAAPAQTRAGPEVVASIAPVHSLVARVMQGVGEPYLLLPPGASPHDHALRPSDAAALQRAALFGANVPQLEHVSRSPRKTASQALHRWPSR